MWGFHTDYLFLLSLWSMVTVIGMLLYMGLQRQGFLLISPLAAMVGSGWVLWNNTAEEGPINIGVFFFVQPWSDAFALQHDARSPCDRTEN